MALTPFWIKPETLCFSRTWQVDWDSKPNHRQQILTATIPHSTRPRIELTPTTSMTGLCRRESSGHNLQQKRHGKVTRTIQTRPVATGILFFIRSSIIVASAMWNVTPRRTRWRTRSRRWSGISSLTTRPLIRLKDTISYLTLNSASCSGSTIPYQRKITKKNILKLDWHILDSSRVQKYIFLPL